MAPGSVWPSQSAKSMPHPRRKVRASCTVGGRTAGTVSSTEPRGSAITRRSASSGSQRSSGSSRRSTPSSARASTATAVTGLVIDAMREDAVTPDRGRAIERAGRARRGPPRPAATSQVAPGTPSGRDVARHQLVKPIQPVLRPSPPISTSCSSLHPALFRRGQATGLIARVGGGRYGPMMSRIEIELKLHRSRVECIEQLQGLTEEELYASRTQSEHDPDLWWSVCRPLRPHDPDRAQLQRHDPPPRRRRSGHGGLARPGR